MNSPLLDLLVTLAAGGMVLGVTILLMILLRVHRLHSRTLREFEYPAADFMLKRAKEARKAAMEGHMHHFPSVNKNYGAILREVDLRLRILNNAQSRILRLKATHQKFMAEVLENFSPTEGDTLNLVYAQHNLEILERVESAIHALRDVDNATRDTLLRKDSFL